MEFLGNVTNCGAETPFRLKIFNTWNIKSLILKSTLLGWGLKHCDKQWNPHCKFYKEIFFRFWNKLRVHWNTWGGGEGGGGLIPPPPMQISTVCVSLLHPQYRYYCILLNIGVTLFTFKFAFSDTQVDIHGSDREPIITIFSVTC